MGLRATFISQDYYIEWPGWLFEKHPTLTTNRAGRLATEWEIKIYTNQIFEDIRQALIELGWFTKYLNTFYIAYVYENDEIGRVILSPDGVRRELALFDGLEDYHATQETNGD